MYPRAYSERNGGFGRRAGPARPVYRADGNGDSQDNPGGTSGADPMRKLILIVPFHRDGRRVRHRQIDQRRCRFLGFPVPFELGQRV